MAYRNTPEKTKMVYNYLIISTSSIHSDSVAVLFFPIKQCMLLLTLFDTGRKELRATISLVSLRYSGCVHQAKK